VAQDEALRQDSGWWTSREARRAYHAQWQEQGALLGELAEEWLARPPEDATAEARQRVQRWSTLVAKLLDDTQAVAALQKDLQRHAQKRKSVPDRLVSVADPDARRAARRGGRVYGGYKSHVSMDQDSGLITAIAVTPMNSEDGPQLLPLIEDELQRGLEIAAVAADSAYSDGAVRAGLQQQAEPIEDLIPEPRAKRGKGGQYRASEFSYDPQSGTVTCPGGHTLAGKSPSKFKAGCHFHFPKAVCAQCPLHAKCLSAREIAAGIKHGRTVYVNQYRALHDAARVKQETPEFKQAMHRRLAVEPKQAEMLNQHGLRRARFRGLSKVRIQGYLTAVAVNLKRLIKLLDEPARAEVCLVT
jgi:IS5 family transposase